MDWQLKSTTDGVEYRVVPSEQHIGTFVLTMRYHQTGKLIARLNSFATLAAALDAAEDWAQRRARQAAAK